MGHGRRLLPPTLDVRSGEGDLVNKLISLANQKIDGNSSAKSLFLMSYRIDFYICSSHLADEMVSSCLRNLVYINNERDLMRMIQPSEPILAYTAATRMFRLEMPLGIRWKLVLSCFEGQLRSSGGIGEVVALFSYYLPTTKNNLNSPNPCPGPYCYASFWSRCLETKDAMAWPSGWVLMRR